MQNVTISHLICHVIGVIDDLLSFRSRVNFTIQIIEAEFVVILLLFCLLLLLLFFQDSGTVVSENKNGQLV